MVVITDEQKVKIFDYTTYILEELIKADIEELDDEWRYTANSAYLRAKLNTYKEVLYTLTKDEKWQYSLEELAKRI